MVIPSKKNDTSVPAGNDGKTKPPANCCTETGWQMEAPELRLGPDGKVIVGVASDGDEHRLQRFSCSLQQKVLGDEKYVRDYYDRNEVWPPESLARRARALAHSRA